MFKINPDATFKAVVKITVPGADQKGIEFEFKHKTRSGMGEWLKNIAGKNDAEVSGEFIVGWSGVISETGDEIPFSFDAFERLCENYPAAAVEIMNGYIKALMESRTKN